MKHSPSMLKYANDDTQTPTPFQNTLSTLWSLNSTRISFWYLNFLHCYLCSEGSYRQGFTKFFDFNQNCNQSAMQDCLEILASKLTTSFKWFRSTGLFRTFILIFKLFKVSFYDVIRRVLRNKYLNTKLFIQMSRKSFFSQYAISHLYVKMLWL